VNYTYPGKLAAEKIDGKQVRIKTAKGDIVVEPYSTVAPCTVSNFVYLTEAGYYNGLKFHRRDEGFVIQGGDPNGNGTGGPGYTFADEPVTHNYDRGIVAMANAGPDTNGSQFFIMLADAPTLPKNYTIFGTVTSGMDVVDKIQIGDAMTAVTVEPLGTK
jgi:cyclophilin family peptidyl-prolyl cis-trans isomerase